MEKEIKTIREKSQEYATEMYNNNVAIDYVMYARDGFEFGAKSVIKIIRDNFNVQELVDKYGDGGYALYCKLMDVVEKLEEE